jgi:hypothetical protein
MQKIITRVLIFGLVGAMISYLVSWGCAFWLGVAYRSPSAPMANQLTIHWEREMTFRGFGRGQQQGHIIHYLNAPVPDATWRTLFFAPQRIADEKVARQTAPEQQSFYMDGCGWPFISHCIMEGHEWGGDFSGAFNAKIKRHRVLDTGWPGLALPAWLKNLQPGMSDWRMRDALPLRPVLPGFLLNSAIHGCLACLVAITCTMIRRAYRRRCGRCADCGYDLRGIPASADRVCPECGRPASSSRPTVFK